MILPSKNESVTIINNKIVSCVRFINKLILSIDSLADQNDVIDISTEFYNCLNTLGLLPHKLELKIRASIILMRNLNLPNLYYNTRLRKITMKRNKIEAKINSDLAKG